MLNGSLSLLGFSFHFILGVSSNFSYSFLNFTLQHSLQLLLIDLQQAFSFTSRYFYLFNMTHINR